MSTATSLRTWLAESLASLAVSLRGAEIVPPPRAETSAAGPGYEVVDSDEYDAYMGGSKGTNDPLKIDEPLNGWDAFFQLWLTNPTVSACVQLIAQAMAAGGYRVVAAKDKTGKSIAGANEADGAALHDFLAACHPFLTFEQILGQILPGLVLANRQFAEIAYTKLKTERTSYGKLAGGLYPIAAQGSIVARLKANGLFDSPAWLQRRQSGGQDRRPIPFDWQQILWLQLPSIVQRGIFSVSPVEMLRVPLGTNQASARHIYSWFESGGKIDLVFTLPDSLGGKAKAIAQSFLEDFKRRFTGARRGISAIVLHSGMSVENSPATAKHGIEFVDVMKFNDEQIAAVFGVDPRLIGHGGAYGSKSEREQAWFEFTSNTVLPKVRHVNAALKMQLVDQALGFTDWTVELCPAKVNPSEESREILTRIHKAAADLGTVSTKSLEDVNALRAEIYPDLNPYEELPASSVSTREIFQYDLLAGDITENEHRAGKGLPPVPGGDKPVRLELSAQGGVQSADRAAAIEQPRARSKAATRFNARAAKSLLDTYDGELIDLLRGGMGGIERKLSEALAAIYPAISKANAADDKQAARALMRMTNFAPGGSQVITDAKRLMASFYGKIRTATKAEVSALAEAQKRAAFSEEIAGGDVYDFIDLAGDEFFDDLLGDLKAIAKKTFREGLENGWSRKEFIQKLSDKFVDVNENDLSTAVRTQTTDFYSRARLQVFGEAGGAVVSVEFTAILDDRTTPVCEKLDGSVFRSLDDPNLDACRPPLHYSCRSSLVPVMVGEDFDPTPTGKIQSAMKLIHEGFGKR